MSREAISNRLSFLVYGDNAWRLSVLPGAGGVPVIIFDAHGLSVKDAQKTLEGIVLMLYCISIELEVIHGYHRGTAIRDMLSCETFNNRLVSKRTPETNPGVTIMQIREAA